MRSLASAWRLLRNAPPAATVTLTILMCLASLSEGIGIIMLVPLLDLVRPSAMPDAWRSDVVSSLALGEPRLESILGVFLALILLRSVILYFQQLHAARYQHRLVDALRLKCFAALLGAEWRWLSARRVSDFADSLMSSAGRIGNGLNQLIALLASSLTFLVYLAVAMAISWKAAAVAMICAIVLVILSAGQRRRSLALGHALASASRAIHANLDEGLSGVRVTKLHNSENTRTQAFASALGALRAEQNRFLANAGATRLLLHAGGAVFIAAVAYAGITWWQVSFGALIAVIVAFARLVPLANTMQQQMHHWLHALPALADLEDLTTRATQAAEPDAEQSCPSIQIRRALALECVSLSLADDQRKALDSVSLVIPARGVTAIVGPSGAGKSSLADILSGLVEPDCGSVLVDGKPINRRIWRRAVAYVEQETFLFHETIRSNLLRACPSAREEDLAAALRTAAATYVFGLRKGIDTIVGDRGVRLSGGERQRIGLARAFLAKPALLILDEPTSGLDPDNEAAIWQNLAKLRDSMAIVVLGHRSSIIDRADHVVLLEAGRVAWMGKPCELRERAGIAA